MSAEQGSGGGTGGIIPIEGRPEDWLPVATGDTNSDPNVALEPGQEYRFSFALPFAPPDWALEPFRSIAGVTKIAALGNTVSVYFRA